MDNSLSNIAREAVSHWGIELAELELLPLTENIAFCVTSVAGQRYVLRLHRPGYHSFVELTSEHQWTHALRNADIDVPVPIKTILGSHYCKFKVHGEVRYGGMLEWVDGVSMASLLQGDLAGEGGGKMFAQIGELLAKIHNQATAWSPTKNFSRHSFNVDGFFGEKPFWGRFWESRLTNKEQREWLGLARDQIGDVLTEYGECAEIYSLIHADLHPGNVIVNDDQLHIIDFDDSGFGWHQYDLAVALFDYRDNSQFSLLQDSLFEGYRKHRHLTDESISYVPLFLVIRALVSIGWFSDRPEHDGRADIKGLYDYGVSALDQALAACR